MITFDLFKKLVFSFALDNPIIFSIEKNKYYIKPSTALFMLSFKKEIYKYSWLNRHHILFSDERQQLEAESILKKMYINLRFNLQLDEVVNYLEKMKMGVFEN